MNEKYTINILFPVLNEERRVERGLRKTVEFMEASYAGQYELNVMDNGSTDATAYIVNQVCAEYPQVKYHKCSGKGVGLAVREGCMLNKCDIVGYMDVDLSTDLKHIHDVIRIFQEQECQFVNGSRLAKQSDTIGRKWYRNISSWGLTTLLRMAFGLKSSDSICGFKFWKKEAIEWLMMRTSLDDGWFYIIEMLLRAEKSGMKVIELPVRWKDDWDSNLHVLELVKYYLIQICKLKKRLRMGQSLVERYSK